MQIMPIDRHDASLPMSFLEQGFNIIIVKPGVDDPVRVYAEPEGQFKLKWGKKFAKVSTSCKAVAKAQEWLGYEHLSFYVTYD